MIESHNGIWTITSGRTGEHRTFQVKTQKDDARFAPGERIVSMLNGSDNTSDYKGFGFVKNDGRIIVWRKCRNTKFEQYARFLEGLQGYIDAGNVEVNHEGRCRRCNRLLTTPESVSSGIGPVCAKAA